MPESYPIPAQPPEPSRYGTRISRSLAIPAFLLLTASVWHVAPAGLANAWYFKANNSLQLWTEQPALFQLDSWQQANTAIDHAIRLHAKHPHYLLTKAKINEWGWYGGHITSKQLEHTEQYYRAAIQARPHWPNAYADFAYYLGVTQFRITEAFEQLELANYYGPYVSETLLRQLAVGLLHWDKLNPTQKSNTLKALEKSMNAGYSLYSKARIIVKDAQQKPLACHYLTTRQKTFPSEIQQRIQKDFCAIKGRI
jgi:hypothetical protein